MKYNCDVLVIGGGAAGLSAALSASEQGASVILLEGAPRVGRKILASGNGRCNLANLGPLRYWGDENFARQVLSHCSVRRVLSWVDSLGLVTVEEEGGRVYPGTGQAASVLDVLRGALARRGVREICDAPVGRIEKKQTGFRVRWKENEAEAGCVIVACGGMAGGKLGHDGKAYGLLTDWGHTLVAPRPALTQLIAVPGAVKGLSGLRLPALLTLCNGGKPVSAAQGEVLFTDYGVSGVCAMQLSRDTQTLLDGGQKPVLYVDFSPMLGLIPRRYDRVEVKDPFIHVNAVAECLENRRHMLPQDALLLGLAPRLLAQRLQGSKDMGALARSLAAFSIPLTGVRGFDYAQVTQGGLRCSEFSPATMESRLCPGLYCAGEMLDVDGDCGGYNLQFAFASGILAGKHAANKEEKQ